MHPVLIPLHENLTLNYPLVVKTLEQLDEDTALTKLTDDTNSFNWILGHLVTGRHHMVGLAGAMLDDTSYWTALYGRGTVYTPGKTYPTILQMREAWVEASEILTGVLKALGEIELFEECVLPFPIKDKTIRGGLAFLTLHECYHIGQLGMMRQSVGLSRFFD